MASADVLSRVLEHFEVPTLASRLPQRFRDTYGLAVPQQYGIACRDVRRCCAIAESLGAGPFLAARIPATGWRERGQLRRCTLSVGLGYAGDTQVEFLGPGCGTDFYSAVLDGAEARLHHAGIYQAGVERIGAQLVAGGYPEAVRGGLVLGRGLSFDYRYYDTRAELGIYLEVLDFRGLGRPLSVEPLARAGAAMLRIQRRIAPP
jgi:hypothetical protein